MHTGPRFFLNLPQEPPKGFYRGVSNRRRKLFRTCSRTTSLLTDQPNLPCRFHHRINLLMVSPLERRYLLLCADGLVHSILPNPEECAAPRPGTSEKKPPLFLLCTAVYPDNRNEMQKQSQKRRVLREELSYLRASITESYPPGIGQRDLSRIPHPRHPLSGDTPRFETAKQLYFAKGRVSGMLPTVEISVGNAE